MADELNKEESDKIEAKMTKKKKGDKVFVFSDPAYFFKGRHICYDLFAFMVVLLRKGH